MADLYSDCLTGEVAMKSQSAIKAEDLNGKYLNMTALENEVKLQREETLRWISVSALSKLRVVWRN